MLLSEGGWARMTRDRHWYYFYRPVSQKGFLFYLNDMEIMEASP